MRAVVCESLSKDFSGTSLRTVDPPAPAAGEVLIRVHAASINFPDLLTCQGLHQHKPPLPFIPGIDLSGTVAAVGSADTGYAVGDVVAGSARHGSFAEFVCTPAGQVRPKPPVMSHVEAAAYQAAYLTAHVSLVRRARLQPGETLLVHGASGGTGMAAIDLGKTLGATVIATTGSADKVNAIRTFGADHVLVARDGFREAVKDLTDSRGADVIFDPIGGDVFDESVRCVAFDGRLLVIGFMSGRIAQIATNMPLIKGFSVVGVRAGEYGRRFPERGQENLDAIWAHAAAGRTRPHIHTVMPLEDYRQAFELLTRREVVGKVVLTVS